MISKKKFSFIFFILLLMAILPYCYLSFFAQPFLDDFAYAHQFQKSDYLNLVIESYLRLNGRYISNFLIYLNPISFNNFSGYGILPLVFLWLTFLALYTFLTNLLHVVPFKNRVFLSLVLTLLFLVNLPNIAEDIYWYTGAVIYHTGIISALFYLSLLIKVLRENHTINKGVLLFLLSVMLFISEGFNEVLTLVLMLILLTTVISSFIHRLKSKKVLLFQLILSVLFALVLIFSPGNGIRGTYYPNNHHFFHSIEYSILQTIRFSAKWILSPPLLLSSLLFVLLYQKALHVYDIFKNSFYLNKWISFFLLFFCIFICVFPPYWATGILGQHRTVNVASMFFLIMWFINLSVWINFFQTKIQIKISKYKYWIAGLFYLSVLFWGNGWIALNDIFSGSARQFKEQTENRHQLLFNAKNITAIQIELLPITANPGCLFISDISDNPDYWTNRAYNDYFELPDKQLVLLQTNTPDQ